MIEEKKQEKRVLYGPRKNNPLDEKVGLGQVEASLVYAKASIAVA